MEVRVMKRRFALLKLIAINLMISHTGKLMVCPDDSLIMHTIQEATAHSHDTVPQYLNRQMMAGESGQATRINDQGEKEYIFYGPIEGKAQWSIAIVYGDYEIYYGLRQLAFNLRLLIYAGLILLGYIIWRVFRNERRLQVARVQEAAIAHELNLASSIQMSLLPKTFPPYPERKDLDIYATLVPAHEVGGDLYDFYIRDEKLFFCVGDVSGKGVPASLIMAITRTLFRNTTRTEVYPKRILMALNEALSADNPDDIFVTFFVGVIDLPTGKLRYASAGHDVPLLSGADEMTCNSNVPLGVVPGWMFVQHEMILPDETLLFLYTDGLTEAMNSNETLFGKQRMKEVFGRLTRQESADDQGQERSALSPQDVITHMTAAVQNFVDGAEQSDDLTMLAIRYARKKAAIRLSRTITMHNDIQTIPQLNTFVSEVCQELALDAATDMKITLAVEEVVVNVMRYSYPEGMVGDILIHAEADDDSLKFVITDSGTPFDPTTHAPADTTLSVEERPIGGLGIHLVRHCMDSINYEQVGHQNVLTLIKRLT